MFFVPLTTIFTKNVKTDLNDTNITVDNASMEQCGISLKEENVTILSSTSKVDTYLMTLEALFIQEIIPKLNTEDEFKLCTYLIALT